MAIQIRRGSNADWELNKNNIVAGEPAVALDTERTFIGTGNGTFMELANIEVIASTYNTSTSYSAGDYCEYQGTIYKANASATGAWDSSKWDAVTVVGELNNIEGAIPQASSTTPKMDGTAAVGSETEWAKGDHVHPTDTSRASQTDMESVQETMVYFDSDGYLCFRSLAE